MKGVVIAADNEPSSSKITIGADVTSKIEDILILIVDIELSHVIFLVMLTLFGIGIFRVNKQE